MSENTAKITDGTKVARVKRKSKAELYSLSQPSHPRHDQNQLELEQEEYEANRKNKAKPNDRSQ